MPDESDRPDPPDPRSGPAGTLVRQDLVARQLDEQIIGRFHVGQRLRILDVGRGTGYPDAQTGGATWALWLARAGHRVTVLESDPAILDEARTELSAEPDGIRERVRLLDGDGGETGAHFLPGSFDVVLCHRVLMYVPEPDPLLAGLARVLASGGLLSLLVRNADALAMRPGLAGDWRAALAAFDAPAGPGRSPSHDAPGVIHSGQGARPVRADRLAALTATLAGIGAPLHTWYGVRVFTDHAGGGERSADVAELDRMLAAEERAGRTDPYRAVAALLHVCGVRA